ncbi:DNA topoisomerase (ATP-hydrolyzing) subunit B [Thermodesulfobium narugense]|nr:DNA topoisomerase (ATP-hydrolyzing) subunit B [Thermodesulfobium narugense]
MNKLMKYTSKDIVVLEGMEAVRKRPGMYIGSIGIKGLLHLVYEVVDNSVDEFMAGYCKKISVTIHKSNYVTIEDDGRGIPTDIHEQTNKNALELVLTTLHAGGKFNDKVYKVSGGLHGVGVSVVNALSERFIATVYRDGKIFTQEFSRGNPVSEIKIIGESDKHGTKIKFLPDKEIFKDITWDTDELKARFQEIAFLNPGLEIVFSDERIGEKETFYDEKGILGFVEYLNKNSKPLYSPPIVIQGEYEEVYVDIALQHVDSTYENIICFANNIATKEGGSHLTAFKNSLTKLTNQYAKDKKILKEDENFQGEDIRSGLTAVISVKLKEPLFEGQTKTKLSSLEAKNAVEKLMEKFIIELESKPEVANMIIKSSLAAKEAREAAKKARDMVRKKHDFTSSISLPGKLALCSSKKPEECELFIVEGDSAGGSAKQGRDRRFQAILPLRGKILNVEKANIDKILANQEIKALAASIGLSFYEEDKPVSDWIKNLRFHKIIIMTDADVDGSHIRTLLLTLFFRYFRPLIETGKVFIAQPPLYMIRKGKERRYAMNDEELNDILSEIKSPDSIQRFKGLGEMTPSQLWDVAMNPEKRTILKVCIEDASEANRIFEILMGDNVEYRKAFIERYAREVKNLDV